MKKTLVEWVDVWRSSHGIELNINTVRKRRLISGLGEFSLPHTFLLTEEEFRAVLETPLPMCKSVIGGRR